MSQKDGDLDGEKGDNRNVNGTNLNQLTVI